ncbi:S8 family serine peptidase [Leucobacter sp. BZR 635]
MRSLLLKGLAVCAAVPLLVTLFAPVASADEPSEPAEGTTLVDRIVAAAEAGTTAPTDLAEEMSLPVTGGGSLTFDSAARITATVMFVTSPGPEVLAAVRGLAEIDEVFTRFPAATVRVDPARLGALSEIPGVASAVPAMRPFTGQAAQAQGTAPGYRAPTSVSTSPRQRAAAPVDRCGPIPVEADEALRSNIARELFSVDGTGVTIGVISDSFASTASPTSWEGDVASGALPGPGNPCGYTTPVTLLSDDSQGSDEGRAMAQLVHGIAPGATILFADAGSSDFEMADHIAELANAGADIIVDDIAWPQETAYQWGVLSTTIERVKNNGVAYFTSAGNSGGVGTRGASAGRPISSWSTAAYRPTACPDWLLTGADDPLAGASGIDCMDFDPDPASSVPYDTLHVRETASSPSVDMRALGSIGEPMFGITTRYEWRFYLVDPEVHAPELIGMAPQLGQHYPGATGQFAAPAGAELRAVMVRTLHEPTAVPPAVRLSFLKGGDELAERAFLGDGVGDVVGPATFGHGGDGSAVSVAALDWRDPAAVRPYSSLGASTLLFEPVREDAAAPAAPLPAPVTPATPHIAGVDGMQTTFFGEAPDYRFYGTSASAPTAAAVAALAQSHAPDLSGSDLTARLIDTARGAADGGPVNPYAGFGFADSQVFGAGLVDAEALLTGLEAAPATPEGLRAVEVTQTSFQLEWEPAEGATALDLEVELVEAAGENGQSPASAAPVSTAPVSAALDGSVTSHRVEGLEPGSVYAVRLAARNQAGASEPALLKVSTRVAPGPKPDPDPDPPVPPTPTPPAPSPPAAPAQPLAQSGTESPWLGLLGAGAILVLGLGVSGAALRRRTAAE